MRSCLAWILIVLATAAGLTACGSKERERGRTAGAPRAEMASERASEKDYIAEEANSPADDSGGKKLGFVFLAPGKYVGERYLEYLVNVRYETKNFELSRKDLLDIVSQYGYLANASAGYENDRHSMTAQLNIKVAELYNVLKLLDRVGSLKSENVSVMDLTRDMVWNQRTTRRLKTRTDRIAKALGQVAAENKNWREREDALERSENALDQSEQGQWDVLDRIAWAKITVTVSGPRDIRPVEIPSFRNALILLLNTFFRVLYFLIVVLPFAAVAGVIWWQRKNIKNLFTRKKDK